ncbi:MAG: hypothetical protein EBU33_07655 [Sphingobacteriia bacterium]|nr:hypothetical protein [Sphingobacteriia bacterium]
MKVAINICYGGFGISDKAFEELLRRKGIEFDMVPNESRIMGNSYYKKGMLDDEDGYLNQYDYYSKRDDLDLIAVIEEMGQDSWSWAAEIVIVEIPDDVKWHVCEHDGMEHVAEDHRTWS